MKSLFAIAAITILLAGCGSKPVVVVYTSQDQVYAEPIFATFEKIHGIKVLPVFDSESIKTAGLVQRLLAEKQNPRADIFWSNEEMLSHELLEAGVLESNSWMRAGYRSRRLIVNTNAVRLANAPKSLEELTAPKWKGHVAMAYPVYGTTAAHMVALRQLWGDEKWKKWCEDLAANKPFVVDGNSVVVKLVGAGEAWIGITDSDDLAAGQHDGLPIESIPCVGPIGDEFLRIPNSIGVVKGAPHPREASYFRDFFKSEGAVESLIKARALDGFISNYGLALKLPAPVSETRELLQKIFARK
jgi:iron(III) transport system substrate-binding protein